jgi:hypothetical protein
MVKILERTRIRSGKSSRGKRVFHVELKISEPEPELGKKLGKTLGIITRELVPDEFIVRPSYDANWMFDGYIVEFKELKYKDNPDGWIAFLKRAKLLEQDGD